MGKIYSVNINLSKILMMISTRKEMQKERDFGWDINPGKTTKILLFVKNKKTKLKTKIYVYMMYKTTKINQAKKRLKNKEKRETCETKDIVKNTKKNFSKETKS